MKLLPHYINKLLFLGIFVFSLPVALHLLSTRTSFFGRAGGIKADLVVDNFSVTPRTEGYLWQNLAQGGEEKNAMLKSVVPQVKALTPKYIRIDHLYDYYNVITRSDGGVLTFNWAKLDDSVNDILATGAKPFFSLSTSDTPKSLSEWQLIVQKTIEHFSRDRKISDVYYEVWNEPDLFGGYRVGSYYDLYQASAIGARNAGGTLPFKFGGPATTALYENWLVPFLKLVKSNSLRFDFYSWHRYSKNTDVFEGDTLNSGTWLLESEFASEFENIERVITEFGANSEVDPIMDNTLGAIHTLAVMSVMDGRIDKIFGFEIKDGPGPQKYWGRWGLLTNDKYGVPEEKPRYKAYLFLNRMIGDRIFVNGQGSWVKSFASKEGNLLKVMVVNYDIEGKHTETVPITFTNLENRKYQLKRTDFLGGTRQRSIEVTNNTFNTVELFSPNSAAFFELIPL